MRVFATLALAASAALAQQPTFDSSGVLNAASLLVQPSIAAGMIVAIKGSNLAASTAVADNSVLPTSLAGTTVTLNGAPAPLIFVSPNQINFQVPSALRNASTARIVVSTAAGSSDPVSARVDRYAFGIFTQDTTGCGPGSVFNIHPNGSMSLNTTADSFDPGHDTGLALYFTGLGSFSDRVDGTPWTFNPADNIAIGGTTLLALYGYPGVQEGGPLKITYAGPAAGQIGVDQINITPYIPDFFFDSCRLPLALTGSTFSTSQLVNISVHRGGGACQSPPPISLGLITWQKNTVIDSVPGASEGVQIQFLQDQHLIFPNPPQPGSFSCCATSPLPPTNCTESGPSNLDAGQLTISGVTTDPITLNPSVYQTTLPVGTLAGGVYRIASTGGPGVGAFDQSASIPAPITITHAPSPGDTLTLPYNFTWTGGDNSSTITLTVRISPTFVAEFTERASTGSITIPQRITLGPMSSTTLPSGDVEIIVTQRAAAPRPGFFNAPGLVLGAEHQWNYIWDYRALKR